jgi:phage gpG-like protein
MGSLLSFEVTGTENVVKGLAAIQDAIADLTLFWREVFAPKYFGVVQDLFSTSGTPRGEGGRFSGGPWAKLSPAYAVWKHKNYPGKPILTRTGDLRESMRWSGSSVGAGGIFEATPSYAIAGTSIPYGRFHQSGTSKMPARSFMPQPDPAVFAPLMLKWILKAHASAK